MLITEAMGGGKERVVVYVCIRSHSPPMVQEGEEMVSGPRFELGTPRFSAGCLKRRRGHKSLRHNVGSSTHSCKSFTALHRVARGNVYGIRFGELYSVDGTSQTLTEPSVLALAMRLPSGLKATALTPRECPSKMARQRPSLTFQSRSV